MALRDNGLAAADAVALGALGEAPTLRHLCLDLGRPAAGDLPPQQEWLGGGRSLVWPKGQLWVEPSGPYGGGRGGGEGETAAVRRWPQPPRTGGRGAPRPLGARCAAAVPQPEPGGVPHTAWDLGFLLILICQDWVKAAQCRMVPPRGTKLAFSSAWPGAGPRESRARASEWFLGGSPPILTENCQHGKLWIFWLFSGYQLGLAAGQLPPLPHSHPV